MSFHSPWQCAGLLVCLGCAGVVSSGDGTPDGGAAPDSGPTDAGGTGNPADAGAAAPDAGANTDAGSSSGPDAGKVADCNTYCASLMATCTGPNAQYGDLQRCLNACPLLQTGTAADTSGNTLGCRMNHLTLAQASPNPECWRAGPFGYGGCGQACEDFCSLAVAWCSPASQYSGPLPYPDYATCMTTCAGYVQIDSATGGVGVDGGWWANGPPGFNTLDCRETHLGNALDSLAGGFGQSTHCEHIQKTPPGGQCLQL
jgi:hypothetical protein